jgi:hypothetical protein
MSALTGIVAGTVLAAALATVTGTAASSAIPTRIAHPTGADAVIFHTESSPNMWGGEYPDATKATVYGDGRLVSGDGSEVQVTERGIQRLLRDTRAAGLLDDTAFGQALVTDQGTSMVTVNTRGNDRTISVYALELPEGDRGLPRPQRLARRHLRRFLHSVGDPSYWRGTLVIR